MQFAGRIQAPGFADGPGQIADNAGKNDQRDAVADPLLRNGLSQPHQKRRSGRQGDDRHQDKPPAGVQNDGGARRAGHLLQPPGDAESLNDAQPHRAVAGVLGDFAAAVLALFGKFLQVRDGHRQQVDDNGRGDVGHDAQRKNGKSAQRAAGKQIHQAQHGSARLLEKSQKRRIVDAGRRNKDADAVHRQKKQCKQNSSLQLGYFGNAAQSL
ncbi:MAG: hypothetical protein BWX45_00420 [Deltaproteobacteria bacterium ADurb.Bin002]|nr:MAG: hypothetical protein BWX45_00420 [Deltaproteobacteria bacterium ADurb.Bin002]